MAALLPCARRDGNLRVVATTCQQHRAAARPPQTFGKTHTFVALARANLAEAYEELGQTEEARALHAAAYDELIAEVQQHEAKLEATKAEDKEESEQVGAAWRGDLLLGASGAWLPSARLLAWPSCSPAASPALTAPHATAACCCTHCQLCPGHALKSLCCCSPRRRRTSARAL